MFTLLHAGFKDNYYLFRLFLMYLFRFCICVLVRNNLFIVLFSIFSNCLYRIVFKRHKNNGESQFCCFVSHFCHNRQQERDMQGIGTFVNDETTRILSEMQPQSSATDLFCCYIMYIDFYLKIWAKEVYRDKPQNHNGTKLEQCSLTF